jgi:hypothetical protein
MHGAPARAIQEVAGNSGPFTTPRDMHLSPAIEGAIRLLEMRGSAEARRHDCASTRAEWVGRFEKVRLRHRRGYGATDFA